MSSRRFKREQQRALWEAETEAYMIKVYKDRKQAILTELRILNDQIRKYEDTGHVSVRFK